jgi:molybdopterin synthase sulfur carrier subunit
MISRPLDVKKRDQYMPVVRFPALMKYYVDNQLEFSVAGTTIGEMIDNLLLRYPLLQTHLFDMDGNLRRHFNIFVNGIHIRELDEMNTLLEENDRVILMASAAGG